MKKEFKTFEFKVSEASEDGSVGIIEGYASTFGNVDLGYDVVEKGAFRKTIKDKKGKFPILLDHDPRKPIGWNLEAEEDEFGLKIRGEIQLITEEARNRYQLAKRACELKTKMGLSIGYTTVKSEDIYDEKNPKAMPVRKLKELKLFEYSLVTFPMNEVASITAAKAQRDELFDLLQSKGYDLGRIEKALAELELDQPKPGAADQDIDPELLQSVDKLTQAIRA